MRTGDAVSQPEHYLERDLYERMRANTDIFEFLQQGSLDGVWFWDLEHPEHEWLSPQFWRMLGYAPETKKHLASEWHDIIHPDDLLTAIENLEKHCADSRHPYDQVVRYRHASGSTVWVRCRGIALRDEHGRPIRMLGTYTDLTALKETEQALRTSNDRYRAMIAAMPDLLFVLNKELRFTDCAAADPSLFALPLAAFIGKTIPEVFGPGSAVLEGPFDPTFHLRMIDAIEDVLDTGELRLLEYVVGHDWFEARIVRCGASEVLVIARNITARKRMDAARARQVAVHAREDLLAAVAHELRNPLSAIQLNTSVLARTLDGTTGPSSGTGPSSAYARIEAILSTCGRMKRLIEDLLEAATIETGKLVVVRSWEQPRPIIDESLEALAPLAEARPATLTCDIPEDLPRVYCEGRRMVQVLSNLIGNAIKFVPANGRIEVSVRVTGDDFVFAVFNDGPGIPANALEHLFERYWKGGGPSQSIGTGLGLYIVKGIVDAHGGRVWAESPPGGGARLLFTIPRVPAPSLF